MTDEDSAAQLALEFRRLGEELTASGDAHAAQQRLVELAGETTGCDWAAVTRWAIGRPPRTVASTGPVPRDVDRIQYELGEGPCLAAAASETATNIPTSSTTTAGRGSAPRPSARPRCAACWPSTSATGRTGPRSTSTPGSRTP